MEVLRQVMEAIQMEEARIVVALMAIRADRREALHRLVEVRLREVARTQEVVEETRVADSV